jgi:hypothetical protein
MKAETPVFDPTRYRLTPGVRADALKRLDRDVNKEGDGR